MTPGVVGVLISVCVQVSNVPAPVAALQAPQGDCCEPAPMPAPPSEAVVKKEQKIREVHVSAALMEEFLRSVPTAFYKQDVGGHVCQQQLI